MKSPIGQALILRDIANRMILSERISSGRILLPGATPKTNGSRQRNLHFVVHKKVTGVGEWRSCCDKRRKTDEMFKMEISHMTHDQEIL